MKKIVLLFLICISYCSFSFGQDFSFDELTKLRTYDYPKFESYVHDKGYTLSHLEYNEDCIVFRKGTSVISYCKFYDNCYSYHSHVSVKFETANVDEYEKIKKSVESTMDYVKTKMRRFINEHYMENIYASDALSVHLYDIAYSNDDKPYYQVEVFSIYSGY